MQMEVLVMENLYENVLFKEPQLLWIKPRRPELGTATPGPGVVLRTLGEFAPLSSCVQALGGMAKKPEPDRIEELEEALAKIRAEPSSQSRPRPSCATQSPSSCRTSRIDFVADDWDRVL